MSTKNNKPLKTVKEIASIYKISQRTLYMHIKEDPSFPFVNVGLRKRYLIDIDQFELWLQRRTQAHRDEKHLIPSITNLMKRSFNEAV